MLLRSLPNRALLAISAAAPPGKGIAPAFTSRTASSTRAWSRLAGGASHSSTETSDEKRRPHRPSADQATIARTIKDPRTRWTSELAGGTAAASTSAPVLDMFLSLTGAVYFTPRRTAARNRFVRGLDRASAAGSFFGRACIGFTLLLDQIRRAAIDKGQALMCGRPAPPLSLLANVSPWCPSPTAHWRRL